MSVITALSPAYPWHVHGMIGAQWVGQLTCAPGLLALFLTFPLTAFQQLICIDNSHQVALLNLMTLLISWRLIGGWVGGSFSGWSLGAN